VLTFERKQTWFELDSLVNRKPVKVVTQSRRNVVELPLSDNQTCSGVQNGLERTQMYRSDAVENAISVVHTCSILLSQSQEKPS